MSYTPRPLHRAERSAYEHHLLALGPDDRWLRFGAAMRDEAVRRYVDGIDLRRDVIFGVFDRSHLLIGAAHLARAPQHAEVGLSVLPGHRRRGMGSALVAACCTRAEEWGVHELFMRCAAENSAMRNLARAYGMRVIVAGSEVDAFLDLPNTGRGACPRVRPTV
jgi:RimJ/RimL family protein N-acetyltransferase